MGETGVVTTGREGPKTIDTQRVALSLRRVECLSFFGNRWQDGERGSWLDGICTYRSPRYRDLRLTMQDGGRNGRPPKNGMSFCRIWIDCLYFRVVERG